MTSGDCQHATRRVNAEGVLVVHFVGNGGVIIIVSGLVCVSGQIIGTISTASAVRSWLPVVILRDVQGRRSVILKQRGFVHVQEGDSHSRFTHCARRVLGSNFYHVLLGSSTIRGPFRLKVQHVLDLQLTGP